MIRRNFLKTSGLISLTPLVPAFLNQLARKLDAVSEQQILVVLELNGGNDGINTVVPFQDENYARLRPGLQLASTQLHRVSDSLGLHPSMTAMKELFDSGRLAIVSGCRSGHEHRRSAVTRGLHQLSRSAYRRYKKHDRRREAALDA